MNRAGTQVRRIALTLLALGAFAVAAPLPAIAAAMAAKADATLVDAASRGEVSRFMVVLADQADVSGADRLATKQEKTRAVYAALRAVAERTQPPVRAELERLGYRVTSYVISNQLLAEASDASSAVAAGDLLAVAARADVARVEAVGGGLASDAARDSTTGRPLRVTAEAAARRTTKGGWTPGVVAIGARDLVRAGVDGSGIVVGIADSGADASHPALARSYRGRGQGDDFNWFDPSLEHSPVPVDTNGHGTHVTGIAVGDTPQLHVGVAPGARWIACRATGPGASAASVLACLDWFLAPTDVHGGNPDPDRAPDVINNSYICPFCGLERAFANLRAAGIFSVGATGNFGPICGSVFSPGDFPTVTAVGATTGGRNSEIAEFSSRGPVSPDVSKPELVTPGVEILSAAPGGGWEVMSGTSMAAPHLAGAVALLWSAHPELRGEVVATRRRLAESAYPRRDRGRTCSAVAGTPNAVYGFGFLDIRRAVCGDRADCP